MFGVRYTCLESDFEFQLIPIEFVILFWIELLMRSSRSFRERDACSKWTIVQLIRLVAGFFLYVVGYFLYVVGDFLYVTGYFLMSLTHAATDKHENEAEWFWRQKRDTLSTAFSAQLDNWQYGKKVLEKIGILLNDLKRNSSGGNEDKQNEDVCCG